LSVASGVSAQSTGPVALDPAVVRQGTALVIGIDAPPATGAIVVRMPKGTHTNTKSRTRLCGSTDAARGTCPAESKIGFGRYVIDVANYLNPGGDTQLTWSIDAFLGRPAKRGDIASVVLAAKLLGADSVATLLTPEIGESVPATSMTKARLRKGPELRIPGVPIQFSASPPTKVTPLRFELNLSAVRRTRQDFIRKIKVPTLSGGYEIRRVKDHRLIGHNLFRTPERCSGTWSYELTVGSKHSTGRIPCQSGF
jgi:hypothetical protein